MARIPEAELERLKQSIALERLAETRGVKLERVGKDLRGRCPFHDGDDDPSLFIEPARNVFHCFGCGAKGSVIDWVMKDQAVTFRHAVEILRADLPPEALEPSSATVRSSVPKLPSPLDFSAGDQELLLQVVGFYHETLKQRPKALEYLRSRGLDHPEMVDRFRLGFCNRTLGYRLPEKSRKAGAEIRGKLQELGVYRKSGHEHFRGCVVIPVFDESGRVAELYGRKVSRELKPHLARHLYLPGPHRGVWNWEALSDSAEVILCESLIDALTFWCAGFSNVTATYGTEGFTADHLEAFERHDVERVLIAYDRDAAGDRAAQKVAERLAASGIGCYRVLFPKGQDANEYAAKVKPAAKSLGLVVRHAEWMGPGAAPLRGFLDPRAVEVTKNSRERPVSRPSGAAEPPAAPPEASEAPPSPPATSPASEPEPPPEPAPPLASSPPPAAVAPPAPRPPDVPTEVKPQEVVIRLGDRRYRVRGLEKNMAYDQLRVNLLAARGEGFHVDTIELYSARQRGAYVKLAAEELGVEPDVVKRDLGKVLLKLEELQEAQIKRALEPEVEAVVIKPAEREAALELLRDPRLLERILSDFERCGVVGEETNKLVGYLAAVSRKLDEPLAVVLQSSSAAGKTSLMEAVLSLMPEEERVQYSAMTGQSLFYMGETDLKHKILAIVEEEGAERAAYALKLLQSEGELTIASTGKDPTTGRLVTHEYRVEGPVMIFLTTTAIEVDEELLNRCLVLSVDEDRAQTRAIHRLQRESQTLEGLLAREDREEVVALHKNAQRLLKPLRVANPYAKRLTFLDVRTRTRRDHVKYLTLIRSIALLHQHQRPLLTVEHRGRSVDYIEVALADIELANRLAHEVLGRSLDELSPQTRRLLMLLDEWVGETSEALEMDRCDLRFTRRDVREHSGWTDFQVRTHLDKLVSLEYVLVHRGGRGQSFVYELLYDGSGKEGAPFLSGLIDVEALEAVGTTRTSRGREGTSRGERGDPEPPSSPQRASIEPPSRSAETGALPSNGKALLSFGGTRPETALPGEEEEESHNRSRSFPPLVASPLVTAVAGREDEE